MYVGSLFMRMFFFMRTCNVEARRAFVLCSIAAVFHQNLSSTFAVLFALSYVPCVPFVRSTFAAVPFALLPVPCVPNACNVHCIRFLSGLSWLFVRRIYLHRLPRFMRLNSLICGKFAV